MVEASELRNLSIEELQDKLGQMKKTLMQYRFQAKIGKLERQTAISETRHDIARVKTVINEMRRSKKGEAEVKS
ncbi:MAG: 50S ribosomal protein L29 [Candidatus Omnitrophica bacterium]|nr:50S ribosomal protein L29 [Candidatus Omnitrophota bacterium]MDD5670923.1 50S ribosomal protein L29 [Candidatus Omnitrophota bacterium]